jgi:hypothetical protein
MDGLISFGQYLAEEQLEEGFVRSATLMVMAQRSKSSGDRAVALFQDGKRAAQSGETDKALAMLFDGLIAMRHQIGSSVSLELTGHLLSAQMNQSLLSRK